MGTKCYKWHRKRPSEVGGNQGRVRGRSRWWGPRAQAQIAEFQAQRQKNSALGRLIEAIVKSTVCAYGFTVYVDYTEGALTHITVCKMALAFLGIMFAEYGDVVSKLSQKKGLLWKALGVLQQLHGLLSAFAGLLTLRGVTDLMDQFENAAKLSLGKTRGRGISLSLRGLKLMMIVGWAQWIGPWVVMHQLGATVIICSAWVHRVEVVAGQRKILLAEAMVRNDSMKAWTLAHVVCDIFANSVCGHRVWCHRTMTWLGAGTQSATVFYYLDSMYSKDEQEMFVFCFEYNQETEEGNEDIKQSNEKRQNEPSMFESATQNVVETSGKLQALYTLGLSPFASVRDIKKRHKELATKLHPDKNPGKNTQEAFVSMRGCIRKTCQTKQNLILPQ